jgi:hypothetical protein
LQFYNDSTAVRGLTFAVSIVLQFLFSPSPAAMSYDRPTHDLDVSRAFLRNLLPDTREDLRTDLAPEGWDASPLARYAFPPPGEQESQARSMMDEMNDMLRDAGDAPMDDDVRAMLFEHMHQREPASDVDDTGACDVIGMALWDVFSDNHDVVDPDGVAYSLGSFRGSAGCIAEVLNDHYDLGRRYTYIDFYMGASLGDDGEDLRSVYTWIFRRLYERDCDWVYTFPRLHLISFDREDEPDDPADYDPGEAVEEDLERDEDDTDVDDLRRRLDALHDDALERARHEPLPLVVRAYRTVFGTLPEGWPHREK